MLVKMIHCLKSLISLTIMRMMSRTKDQFFSFYNPRYQNMNYCKMGYSLLNLMSPIVILSLLVVVFSSFVLFLCNLPQWKSFTNLSSSNYNYFFRNT